MNLLEWRKRLDLCMMVSDVVPPMWKLETDTSGKLLYHKVYQENTGEAT